MRISQKDLPFRVTIAPGSPCPVRLRLAGLILGITPGEAIRIANDLADAVEAVSKHQGEAS